MAKGIKGKVQDEGSAMTQEELEAAEARLEGKVSPLPAPRAAVGVEVEAPDGMVRRKVGNFISPAKVGDAGTLKHFAHIKTPRDGWIEMTPEEASQYEADGVLVGYSADEGLGLIKRSRR